MSTPTPRVAQHLSDELERAARLFCSGGPLHPQLPAGWAQVFKEAAKALRLVPLERELAEARAEIASLTDGMRGLGDKIVSIDRERAQARAELEAVRKERDAIYAESCKSTATLAARLSRLEAVVRDFPILTLQAKADELEARGEQRVPMFMQIETIRALGAALGENGEVG